MKHADLIAMLQRMPVADLATFSALLASAPEGSPARTYTIMGFDKSPYITRTILPRVDGQRVMLHRIHREDQDRYVHNHPWSTAEFTILTGGYIEERLVDGVMIQRLLKPGDTNQLDASTFHRVISVEPETWTVGLIGERVQEWGFLVDGAVVQWETYFARKGHVADAGSAAS